MTTSTYIARAIFGSPYPDWRHPHQRLSPSHRRYRRWRLAAEAGVEAIPYALVIAAIVGGITLYVEVMS